MKYRKTRRKKERLTDVKGSRADTGSSTTLLVGMLVALFAGLIVLLTRRWDKESSQLSGGFAGFSDDAFVYDLLLGALRLAVMASPRWLWRLGTLIIPRSSRRAVRGSGRSLLVGARSGREGQQEFSLS